MSKADENALGELHGMLAEYFKSVLVKGKEQLTLPPTEEDSDTPVILSPTMLGQIRQFLKDNNIEADTVPGTPLDSLTEEFPFEVRPH